MKYALLALLAKGPAHGYELKQAYEDLFSAVYRSLNAGQIYTTLSRLERDGLVEKQHVAQEGRPDKRVYELTCAGQEALAKWLEKPVSGPRLKDEFFMKLVLARLAHIGDPQELIRHQRLEYLQALHNLNELIMQSQTTTNPAAHLLIKGAILHLTADLEWLELCEEELG